MKKKAGKNNFAVFSIYLSTVYTKLLPILFVRLRKDIEKISKWYSSYAFLKGKNMCVSLR